MPWITESFLPEPKTVTDANDELNVVTFLKIASEGSAVRWTGDYHNAKALLSAVERRIIKNTKALPKDLELKEVFHRQRQAQSHKARMQSRLLIPIEADLSIPLRRAPDVKDALKASLSEIPTTDFELSLRELLGMIGAYEWRKKGIRVPSIEGHIHPHYGVFFPVRSEYLDLVAKAPIAPTIKTAFDIGTGTGVLAAILAKRGIAKITATDSEKRAIDCAAENIARLGYEKQIAIQNTPFFPAGKADLIICNPPWVPARATSRLETAVYDFESQMLRGFLSGVKNHLSDSGEVWLIISDLAERMGLRTPNEMAGWIQEAGLKVVDRLDTAPKHAKSKDQDDPLYEARSQEITSLWRLTLNI